MDKRFKKIFSVLVAVLVGASIIFFAWKAGVVNYSEEISSVDNTGWKDSLSVVPQTDLLKTLSAYNKEGEINTATTTTDIVARELLINYALVQGTNMSTTTLSDYDARVIAQTAIDKIEIPNAKQYAEKNLNISANNSPEAITAYVKEINDLIRAFNLSQNGDDISVVFAVPTSEIDIKRTQKISQTVSQYQKLITDLLLVRVPSALARPHLLLVQKYANIQATLKPMSEIFTDPLKGLVALSNYRNEISGFDLIAKEYETSFLKK